MFSPLLHLALLAATVQPPSPGGEALDSVLSGLSDPSRREVSLGYLADLDVEGVRELLDLVPGAGRDPHGCETLREAVRVVPRDLVMERVTSLVGRAAEPEERAAGLRILSWCEDPSSVGLCLSAGRWVKEPDEATRFGEALTHLVGLDHDELSTVDRNWRQLPAALLPAVVDAVSLTRDPRGISILGDVLAGGSIEARFVLERLPMVVPPNWPGGEDLGSDAVLKYLDPERGECRSATLVVGRLGDGDSVPLLIELLGAEARGIRENAHWALREISGLEFASDARTWSTWYDQDRLWFGRESERAFLELGSDDPKVVLGALRSIGARRLHRHALAREVESALGHSAPEVRVAVCELMAVFASRGSVSPLIQLLEDPEPSVRSAALEALRSITGQDGTEDPEDWAEVEVPVRAGLR